MLGSDGQLTLASDPRVRLLGADYQPIRLPGRDAQSLRIDPQGTIRDAVTSQPLAQLKFASGMNLRPIGGNLFAPDGPLGPAGAIAVRAGFVERSNVDPTTELTRLIEAGRLLEANANMIRHQDSTLGRLIDAARVG